MKDLCSLIDRKCFKEFGFLARSVAYSTEFENFEEHNLLQSNSSLSNDENLLMAVVLLKDPSGHSIRSLCENSCKTGQFVVATSAGLKELHIMDMQGGKNLADLVKVFNHHELKQTWPGDSEMALTHCKDLPFFSRDSKVCKSWIGRFGEKNEEASSEILSIGARSVAAHPSLPLFICGSKGGTISLQHFGRAKVEAKYAFDAKNPSPSTSMILSFSFEYLAPLQK